MKKVRAAVVGVGYLGKFHAEKYAKMENVDLVGVVDTHSAQATEIAEKFNTRAFTHCADLFGHVDAVSIAVPTPLHYEIGKSFLENGIDVLIEKPITTTVEEADELIDIARRKNLCFRWGSWNALIRRWLRCSILWIIRFLSSPTGWAFTRNVART